MQLLDRLAEVARKRPDALALHEISRPGGAVRRLSYGELHRAVGRLSARLSAAAPDPGHVVLLCCPNQVEYHVALFAALQAGVSVFPISPESSAAELTAAARRSAARLCLGVNRALDALRGTVPKLVPVSEALLPGELAAAARPQRSAAATLLLQSSGTTATPKIVRRSGPSLDAVAAAVARALRLTEQDCVLAVVPCCHSYGLEHGVLAPQLAGCSVHLGQGFDPGLVRAELRAGVTIFPGVPFMFESLAGPGEPLQAEALRWAYSAGAPLPRPVGDALWRQAGLRLGQFYGATEIGSVTFSPPAPDEDPTSVGQALDGVRICILDPESPHPLRPLAAGMMGHIAVAAPSMLSDYLDEPAPLVDGFFLTGDLGRLDESGRLYITGRIKLLIDVGGLKVNPLEVESVLCQHPAVGACVVLPLPVSSTIVRLRAIVVPRPGAGELDLQDLRRFARTQLSAYKIPRTFEIRDSLPRSAAGKVQRSALEP